MRRIPIIGLIALFAVILYACNFGGQPTESNVTTFSGDLPALQLTVQAQNANSTFNTVGQVINYAYVVTNTGNTTLTGPVSVADNKVAVTCPNLNTVGNQDNNLDSQESVTCTSAYAITQADLNAGSVTNTAMAAAGGINSNSVNTTVAMTENKVLTLTNTANPTTYNQANQTITFTFSIKNSGTAALGPAQFVIKDDRLGTVNCEGQDSIIGPNESLVCSATYTTTQNDLGVNQLVFSTSASGGGAGSLQPVSVTVTNTSTAGGSSSTYTRGSTIVHQVNDGEWMLQIARCYGADFNAVRNANPQVIDASKIWPIDRLSIPNIGSSGTIYGPPCVTYYTAQSGDTWNSIAQKHNADIAVLMEANKSVTLAAGVKLKIPLNSAGATQPPPAVEAIRLTIPAGSNTVTVSGTLEVAKGKVRYVLAASQGQTLSIKLTAPANEVALAVYTPSNTALKAQDTTLTWSGTIPANGDYFIELVSVLGTSNKLFTLEAGLATPVSAFQRVADINTGAGDSNPAYLAVFNGALYFNATGYDNTGAELWKYDAVSNAASRVTDIFPGANGSNPTFMASFNDALYFGADGNDGAGIELWRFNGSATGRLSDMNSGAGNANPLYMTVFNNFLYFSANGNDGAGVELWRTDGNTTSRVTDIYSGAGDANPAYLAVYNNALYFGAISNDGAGNELWKYDGTTATRVTDINSGVGNSTPAYLTVFNNALYFSANANDGAGTELWKYDGTTPSRAADINPGAGDSIPAYLTVFNNALYMSANGNDSKGFEIWKFDGTTASRVSDLNTAGDTSPAFLIAFNNELFFQANGGDGAGRELWRYKAP